jgi:hypothetical protein
MHFIVIIVVKPVMDHVIIVKVIYDRMNQVMSMSDHGVLSHHDDEVAVYWAHHVILVILIVNMDNYHREHVHQQGTITPMVGQGHDR